VLRRRGGRASIVGPVTRSGDGSAIVSPVRTGAGRAKIGSVVSSRRISFMPQQPALPPWLRAGELLELYGGTATGHAAVCSALELQPLLWRRIGSLSGGEVQAVLLAATVARAHDVLILDEPFAHLDFRRRLAAIELMRNDTVGRLLTLVSSQNAADVATFCDWYLVLAHGRAVFCGSLDNLLDSVVRPAEHRLPLIERRLVTLLA
jgi:ABC-type multidrug transport system ATPase subunit